MIRKSVVAFSIVLALAFAAILTPMPASQAQQGCKAFHGIVQGSLPTPNQFAATDTWGGPVYSSLAGEFLSGGMSGQDGTQYGQGGISIFKDGMYKVCLISGPGWGGPNDCLDSFTYVPQAVVIWPTAANSLGTYKAVAKIVSGTHRFVSASGHLEIAGSFTAWPDASSPFGVFGRWNAELSGSICGVQ